MGAGARRFTSSMNEELLASNGALMMYQPFLSPAS
jgi:hypothetical protein